MEEIKKNEINFKEMEEEIEKLSKEYLDDITNEDKKLILIGKKSNYENHKKNYRDIFVSKIYECIEKVCCKLGTDYTEKAYQNLLARYIYESTNTPVFLEYLFEIEIDNTKVTNARIDICIFTETFNFIIELKHRKNTDVNDDDKNQILYYKQLLDQRRKNVLYKEIKEETLGLIIVFEKNNNHPNLEKPIIPAKYKALYIKHWDTQI